jgi:hypothetical protein
MDILQSAAHSALEIGDITLTAGHIDILTTLLSAFDATSESQLDEIEEEYQALCVASGIPVQVGLMSGIIKERLNTTTLSERQRGVLNSYEAVDYTEELLQSHEDGEARMQKLKSQLAQLAIPQEAKPKETRRKKGI